MKSPIGCGHEKGRHISTAEKTRARCRRVVHLDDRGMLFIFGDAQPWTFWMKNTKIPLDIIWMDGRKTIIHIERNVPICTRQDDGCPQYHSDEGALYVLELGGGRAEALQLQRGMRLSFKQP